MSAGPREEMRVMRGMIPFVLVPAALGVTPLGWRIGMLGWAILGLPAAGGGRASSKSSSTV